MRALLFHCRNYSVKIEKLADRPKDISPEKVTERTQYCPDCVVVLTTVETGDNAENVAAQLANEVANMCEEVHHHNIVILPFAHLSNNLAPSEEAIRTINHIEKNLTNDFEVKRAHFGSHKALLLDIYGHPGNARYREF